MQSGAPIVVDVIKQPPVAPELGMGDVVLGAVGLTGAVMIGAIVVGLLLGAIVVLVKQARDRAAKDRTESAGHASLKLD